MTDAEGQARELLTRYLEHCRDAMRAQAARLRLAYAGQYDFVLQHASWYEPAPLEIPERGAPRLCYGNAIMLAVKRPGLVYVEGFACAPGLPVPFPHAWNADADGRLVDITWSNQGLAYFGCVFSLERADDATWRGDACVLDDWKRRWPILRERWTGERPVPDYRPSPALQMAQHLAARGKLLAKGKAYVHDKR